MILILNITDKSEYIIERGVYRFGLSEYPNISESEMRSIINFINYEKSHGRQTEIVCEDKNIITVVNDALAHPETIEELALPDIYENECCNHKGCLTEYVCHSTNINAAKSILSCGRLLSAVRAYGKTGEELAFEKRGSLWSDPPDFFEYIMFTWGNCKYGEYVVMSDYADDPNDGDFGKFNPGIRFYFRYNDMLRHPGHTFDGYHIIKVRDEILLSDYLHACVVPERYKSELENFVLPELAARVHYLPHEGLSLRDWTEKSYNYIKQAKIRLNNVIISEAGKIIAPAKYGSLYLNCEQARGTL